MSRVTILCKSYIRGILGIGIMFSPIIKLMRWARKMNGGDHYIFNRFKWSLNFEYFTYQTLKQIIFII